MVHLHFDNVQLLALLDDVNDLTAEMDYVYLEKQQSWIVGMISLLQAAANYPTHGDESEEAHAVREIENFLWKAVRHVQEVLDACRARMVAEFEAELAALEKAEEEPASTSQ